MTTRNVHGRILKLEAHRRMPNHQDHFLLVWYPEGLDVASVVHGARHEFGPNDKVGVAPWTGDDLPAPRWVKDYPKDLSDRELECVTRRLKVLARSGDPTTDAPDSRQSHLMTDQQLAFLALRVEIDMEGIRV